MSGKINISCKKNFLHDVQREAQPAEVVAPVASEDHIILKIHKRWIFEIIDFWIIYR
jgi:hypothetical protein